MATPVVDDITCQRLGEQIKGGREFTTLSVDKRLSVVAAALREPELDQELDPEVTDMIDGTLEPLLQCGLTLAGGAHDGAGRSSIARFGCAFLDEAAVTEPIERSIHQGSMHRQDPSEVGAGLEFPSNGETVCGLLADKS